MQPKFNEKAVRRTISSALMFLPNSEMRTEVDVSRITHIEYESVTDRKGKETGESLIRIYLGENYTYARMDENLFRAMLKKAREGYDVDYRTFEVEWMPRPTRGGHPGIII